MHDNSNPFSIEFEEMEFVNNHESSWDAPPSDPWLDIKNAMRLISGDQPIIDAKDPVDGVYVITNAE